MSVKVSRSTKVTPLLCFGATMAERAPCRGQHHSVAQQLPQGTRESRDQISPGPCIASLPHTSLILLPLLSKNTLIALIVCLWLLALKKGPCVASYLRYLCYILGMA